MAINQPPTRRINQPGTGFTNIQRVLQANLANRLGSAVAGGVQRAGQQARGAITGAGEQFKTEFQKEQERLAQEKERSQRVLGDVTGATEEDVRAFQGILDGKALGPQGIKNVGELGQQAREAGQLGRAAGTEAGRYGLLQRHIGGGQQYTGGQQRLDALLLGQTAAPQLREARRSTLGLESQLQRQQAAASAAGQELVSRARGLADVTRGGLEEQVVVYGQTMQQKAKEAAEARKSYVEQAKENLKQGLVDQDTLQALGLAGGERLYRSDLSQLLNESDLIATPQNVQTTEDFARIQALQQLSGQKLTGEASAILPQFTDKSQVGQFLRADKFAKVPEGLAKNILAGEEQLYKREIAHPEERLEFLRSIMPRLEETIRNRISRTIQDLMENYVEGGGAQLRWRYPELRQFQQYGKGSPQYKEALSRAIKQETQRSLSRFEQERETGQIPAASSEFASAFRLGQVDYIPAIRERLQQQAAIDAAKQKFQFDRTLRMLS